MRGWKGLALLSLIGSPLPAAAQERPAPVASVEGGAVLHSRAGVSVRVPPTAAYAGGERFTLYDVADAEVHVFVEADNERRIRRLYWIQFESYLPSKPELSYNYADGNRPIQLDGTTTWLRAGPVATTGPVRAGSDRAQVMEILTRAGYLIPPEMLNLRLVQLLDDPAGTGRGRQELMLIYSEDLVSTGVTLAELAADGADSPRWKEIEKALIERATSAISVQHK